MTWLSGCPIKRYSTLVDKLRDRFSPKDKEIFYQQLMTYRKKSEQTWEDLAQEKEVLSIKAYGGMEETYRDSMAAKAFVEAVVDKQVRRKLREKHPRTINDAVKCARMIEADKLREEQWQEFDREDKEKSKGTRSDKNRAIEDCNPDEGVAQAHVEAPSRTSKQFGAKGGKKKKPRPTIDITCYFCKMVRHIQKNCPFKLMMGGRQTLMPAQGLTSL